MTFKDMEEHYATLFLLVSYISVVEIDALDCLMCQNIDDPFSCNNTVSCQALQVCFACEKGGIYNMGCTDTQHCGGFAGSSIIGRDIQRKQSLECHECCSTNSCNSLLCQHKKPTSCRDDETVDCAKMNSLFHICADIHQASLVCPQFCRLCTLVNGNWGEWSAWSNCDVTCGNGSQTRLRNCSNPAPANGGRGCLGNSSDRKNCMKDACPVHGGWSEWNRWGVCSVTCGVGMQNRDRSCSKPYPSLYGNHCFGHSRDYKVCMPGACTDGAWSTWRSWGPCTHSCGGGIKSRTRTCTNPRPSMLGRYCDGDPNQTTMCSKSSCPDKKIAFTASGIIADGYSVIFPTVNLNSGNSYDKSTGKFICHVPGIYHFVATLIKSWGTYPDYIKCYILHNTKPVLTLYEDPYSSEEDKGSYSFTMSATLYLQGNDTVNIGDCNRPNLLINDSKCSFTGFLVAPDN